MRQPLESSLYNTHNQRSETSEMDDNPQFSDAASMGGYDDDHSPSDSRDSLPRSPSPSSSSASGSGSNLRP